MAGKIHVNDVGVAFRPTFKDQAGAVVPVDTAADLKMWFEKPPAVEGGDPETVEFDAQFYTDGTDGVAQYVTEDGDLDRPGEWRVQAVAHMVVGEPLHSDILKFKVYPNLRSDS